MLQFVQGNTNTSIYNADRWSLWVLDRELRYPTAISQAIEGGFRPPEGGDGWDGWMRMLHQPKTMQPYFATGLLGYVQRICAKMQIPYTVEDARQRPMEGMPEHASDQQTIIDRDYQLDAEACALSVGRGVLNMPPRCHGAGESILRSDGSLVRVEEVRVGDRLLGPDGTPREVREVHTGEDELYRVTPNKWADPFVVNKNHKLVLDRNARLWRRFEWREEVITVGDYVERTKNWKRRTYLRFSGAVEFEDGRSDFSIDPYFLGLLLGDGYLDKTPELTSDDAIIREHAVACGQHLGLTGTRVIYTRDRTPKVVFSNLDAKRTTPNDLVSRLKGLGLWGKKSGTKFIPALYLQGTISARRELLAGLIDTDGHLANGTYFEFVSKSQQLAHDVSYLSASLGLRTSCKVKAVEGVDYYRVNICGPINSIPTRLPRKQSTHGGRPQDSRDSFSVAPLGRGAFYGFTVSGDHRYLDDGFILQHNSGKTRTMISIVTKLGLPTLWTAPTDAIVQQTVRAFESFFGKHFVRHQVGAQFSGDQGATELHKAVSSRVLICTAATAVRLPPEVYNSLQCLVVDEWHHAAAKTYREIMKLCDHIYYRFGMTGTFFRSGDDEMAMHALLSNEIYRVGSDKLLEMGYLLPTRIVYVPCDSPRLQCPKKYTDDGAEIKRVAPYLKYGVQEHTYRNQLCAYAAAYLHNILSRKVLVLVSTKEQGRRIERMISTQIPEKVSGAEFNPVEFVSTDRRRTTLQKVIKAFNESDEVRVLIGTSLVGEGVDLPPADALVYARGGKAEVELAQNSFRVCTAWGQKTSAIIVDFADRHNKNLMKHSRQRLECFYREPIMSVEVLPSIKFLGEWCRQFQRTALETTEPDCQV